MDANALITEVLAVRDGDVDRYERLVVAFWPAVSAELRRLGLGGADADDVCQQAFVRAWRQLHRLEEPARFRPWVLAIAGNLARDLFRRRDRERRTLTTYQERSGPAVCLPEHGTPDEHEARRTRIQDLLGTLAASEREVLSLRFAHGLNCREIADRLGRNHATVRSTLYRALERLRALAGLRALTDAPKGGVL